MTTRRGEAAEAQAENHLQTQGIRTLARNFRCRVGEIDLVMPDGDTVAFVEVRYRKSTRYGHPIETITRIKQPRIIKCAEIFLMGHRVHQGSPCRFDVVAMAGPLHSASIEWISDAFQA